MFVDDRGFPDEFEYYKNLLHNIDGGPILHKLKHPPLSLDEVDPKFFSTYDKFKHGAQLKMDLTLSQLEPAIHNQIYALVKKYWSVFDDKGVFVPVKKYECVNDTRDAKPIAIEKILYGPREIPIMQTAIAALKKVGHIQQITDRSWLFKALLAPKPHQEHMCDIDKFIWHFYVNYILLNFVTRIIAYPIPHCDLAIDEEFRLAFFFWLWDAPIGYHQLAVALASQEKLAFQGPNAIKWTHTIMPFGPMNGPAMFINFIHNVDSQWKALSQQSGLVIDDNTNTKIIVDNIFSWSDLLEKALLYMECQLCICQAYQLIELAQKLHLFQVVQVC